MSQFDFIERTSSEEPVRGTFSVEGGGKQGIYDLYGPSDSELQQAIISVIGGVNIAPGNGSLNRTLPASHPQYTKLYAKSVTVQGIGTDGGDWPTQDADTTVECPPIAPQFPMYGIYRFTVDFTPRPYALFSDSLITSTDVNWFPPNDTGSGSGVSITYYDEWNRFTQMWADTTEDYLTAQLGQMKFNTGDGDKPDGKQYVGSPRVFLPNIKVHMMWAQVPYRYCTSMGQTFWDGTTGNYLNKFRGYVNQLQWGIFGPGELLYEGYTPTIYTPALTPDTSTAEFSAFGAGPGSSGGISADKVCNIQLNFTWTTRTSRSAPTLAQLVSENRTANNRNFVIGGHNLEPWFIDRSFYFPTSTGQNNGGTQLGTPPWLSVPLQLLFSDPDATS